MQRVNAQKGFKGFSMALSTKQSDAGGDDLSAWVEATLNEATAVPDRFHHTALVGECGDRSLNPSSPGLFDANVNNPHANRCRASAYKFSNWRDRSAVFVTPRKIEEEISHAMDP